jgi:hypothetical protein
MRDEWAENMPLNTMHTGSQITKGFIEVGLAYITEDIFRLCADLFVRTQDDKEEPGRYDDDRCGRQQRSNKPTAYTKRQRAGCATPPHRIPDNLHELKQQSMPQQRGRWSAQGVLPMKRKDR